MSWIPEVWAKLWKYNPNSLKIEAEKIADAIKKGDLTSTAELLKEVYEGSKRGSYIFGVHEDGVFVGKISEDFITRASWALATAGSASAIFYGVTNKERNRLQDLLDQEQAENDAIRKTNAELVKTNSELVVRNKELVVANNELAMASKKCQSEGGFFTWLIGRK